MPPWTTAGTECCRLDFPEPVAERVRHAELGQRFHWRAASVKKGDGRTEQGQPSDGKANMTNCHPVGQFQSKDWYKARSCAAVLLSDRLGPTPMK